MDIVREAGGQAGGDDRDGITGEAIVVGTDERRMHVRAYNHWISLLRGRGYPMIADLDPAGIADFGPNSVLLDFTDGQDDPTIRFLGKALREECCADSSIVRVSQVPGRSLLSRLTDHYLQIIANQAPIGFEAEFVGTRGFPMMYRGIVMPFSSTGESIDYLYGVINWKEVVDSATQNQLATELEMARRTAPRPRAMMAATSAWADGPSANLLETPVEATPASPTDRMRAATPVATVAVAAGADEFVVLLARAAGDDTVDILGRVDADPDFIAQAIRQLAA
jgi:hypothetical protein